MKLLIPALLCVSVAPHFGIANEKWDKWTAAVQTKLLPLNIRIGQSSNFQAKITSIPSHPPGDSNGWVSRIGFKSVEKIDVASSSGKYGTSRTWGACDVKYDPREKKFSLPQEQRDMYVRSGSGNPSGKTKPGNDGEITIVDAVGGPTKASDDAARKAGEAVVELLNEEKWESE